MKGTPDALARRAGSPTIVAIARLKSDASYKSAQAFARRTFGGASPIGRRIRIGRVSSPTAWLTIVGVSGDVRHSEITGRAQPEIYVPLAQAPTDMMMLAANTAGNPDDLADAVQKAIASVDPLQPVYHVKPLRRLIDEALLPQASAMSMMTMFAVLALLLSTVGIYGVVSYVVSQQAREFGVRLALGASPGDLMRLVLWRGVSLVGIGTAIGAAGALGVTRLLGGILYGVTATDWPTYLVVAAGLILVGGIACYIPARRGHTVGSRGCASIRVVFRGRGLLHSAAPPIS